MLESTYIRTYQRHHYSFGGSSDMTWPWGIRVTPACLEIGHLSILLPSFPVSPTPSPVPRPAGATRSQTRPRQIRHPNVSRNPCHALQLRVSTMCMDVYTCVRMPPHDEVTMAWPCCLWHWIPVNKHIKSILFCQHKSLQGNFLWSLPTRPIAVCKTLCSSCK